MASPKLRFKEFDGDWSSVCLLEISSLVTKGTTPKQFVNGDINFLKIEAITENGFDLSKCQTINSEIHNKELKRSVLKEGDILFAIAGATIGKNAIVQKKFLPANTNQALAIVRLKEEYSNVFVSKVLNSPLMEKYIDSNISTGAQPNLNLKQIGDFSFDLPKIKEQTKIASFLSAVDEKISELTQKHELLSQYKQGMMQKLFSQQIRFKADDGSEFGEWAYGNLGDITAIQGGYAFKSNSFGKGTTKVVRIGDIRNNIFLDYFNGVYSDEIPDVRYLVSKDAIVMALSGATFGKLGKVVTGSAYLNQRVATFKVNEKTTNEYVYQVMLSKDFFNYIQSIPSASAQPNISNQDVINFEMLIPCLEEQNKIANFLSAIDQKIEVVAQQIEQAKQWKRGLLQQMFV
nr:restriction endonuclease subunit S [Acinetobacter sp. YH16037]